MLPSGRQVGGPERPRPFVRASGRPRHQGVRRNSRRRPSRALRSLPGGSPRPLCPLLRPPRPPPRRAGHRGRAEPAALGAVGGGRRRLCQAVALLRLSHGGGQPGPASPRLGPPALAWPPQRASRGLRDAKFAFEFWSRPPCLSSGQPSLWGICYSSVAMYVLQPRLSIRSILCTYIYENNNCNATKDASHKRWFCVCVRIHVRGHAPVFIYLMREVFYFEVGLILPI